MQPSQIEQAYVRWRVPVLVASVLLIVVLPFVLARDWSLDGLEAAESVRHTLEVEAAVHALEAQLRESESYALAIAAGADDPAYGPGLERSIAQTAPALARLEELSRDNPGQQILIGRLHEQILRRMEICRRLALGAPLAERRDLIHDMGSRYRVRELFDQILGNEQRLLNERKQYAQQQQQRIGWLTMGAVVVQVALLALVIYLLYRLERKRLTTERRLRRASARALAVLQTVREPIALLDPGLRVIMHNTAFAELYDTEEDELRSTLDEVGNGAWRDPVIRQRLVDVLVRNRELWDFEHVQRTADGVVRTMLINARRMQLPDREDDAILMTVSDISAHKVAQQRIANLNRQLEGKIEQISEVNRELEAFSYSVSHDLRAPLRHVAGFSDKLSRHLGDGIDEKGRHYLGVIGSSAQRMSSLIDDLLVYSRLGRSALRLQAVDMQSLVAEARAVLDSNLEADAEAGGRAVHRVEWRIQPLPIVVADENMMRQVWLNLLGNAVKYSARREPALVEVGYHLNDEGAHHFSVRDNGVGFDMEYAHKLFGVFQRLHKPSEYPGTGIGLASVRRVLTRHGGQIWAESEPDKGAVFHFVLPPPPDASFSSENIE